MISLAKFIDAIHDAILKANDALVGQNEGILDRFFEEEENDGVDGKPDPDKLTLRAKSVVLEYPQQGPDGTMNKVEVMVPLITLVPLNTPQIQKVKMTAEFQLTMVNDELQLLFPKESPPRQKGTLGLGRKAKGTYGTLEITMAPGEMADGLKELVEGYEQALKAQIPH